MTNDTQTTTIDLTGRKIDELPDLLTIRELSTWAQIPVSTLYDWNFKEVGPVPMKFGKHLRYSRDEIQRWMASLNRHEWTAAE